MIIYKFNTEREYAMYYVNKLNDSRVLKILKSGEVHSKEDALCLSEFFWNMVGASIQDKKAGLQFPWEGSAEFWEEKLMNSFSFYLEREGYEKEWDEVVNRV
ncbi:hypothetical protein A9Q91_01385 [Candidatus Gracilibacteria bacterium 28_42_T64]|nr:hypothetical protein A9Q91_01385 [Candidatus Gracilibacteria bacterium 28_42_T64]